MVFFGLQPIEEAYFGKTPEVLAIEKTLEKIRKGRSLHDMNKASCKKLVNSKDWAALSKAIEKAFGFHKVTIGIDLSDFPNLYTFPLDAAEWGDLTNQYISTPSGLRFKKELKAETLFFFTKGILFDDMFSNAEMTAVILHEIGHNFEDAVIPFKQATKLISGSLNLFSNISTFKNTIGNTEIFSKPVDFIISFLKAKPKLLYSFAKAKSKNKNYNYINSGIMDNDGYLREKFADHFATMYGYGPELGTALSKIESDDGEIYFNIVGGICTLGISLVLTALCNWAEPHPQLSARIKNTINELNYELLNNKELSDSDRDDIQKQIDETKKAADNYYKTGGAGSFISRQYFKFLYDHLNNGDWVGSMLSNLYDLDKIDQNIESRKK